MAALLADVNRDAHALVAVVFDGFDLAAAHGHALPEALAHLGLGGGGAAVAGIIEDIAGNLLERGGFVGEFGAGHDDSDCGTNK